MRALDIDTSKRVRSTKVLVSLELPFGSCGGLLGEQVLEIGTTYLKLGSNAASTTVTLDNTGSRGRKVDTYWDREHPVHGSAASITLFIDGVGINYFTGFVNRISAHDRTQVTFELQDRSILYRKPLGTRLEKDTYPNLPDAHVGQIIPWVWGTVPEFMPVLVDEDKITKLSRALARGDTTAYVMDASEFPTTYPVTIKINEEKMTYAGIDTSTPGSHQLTGLTRATDSTEEGSHAAGNQVVEVGNMVFLFANHDVSQIDNVKFVDEDNNLVSAATADYAVVLTKPAKITFTECPEYEVEAQTHKLKLVDMDTVDASSNCDDPTYACGDHADWTETNFARIYNAGTLDVKRVADVDEPPGDIIRLWLVVEALKNCECHAWVNDGGWQDLGTLVDITNTPDDIKEDQTIITMAANFQDAHTHVISGSDHAHDADFAYHVRPAVNDGTYTTSASYDSDWDSYDYFTLAPGNLSARVWTDGTTSPGDNKRVRKIRCRARVARGTGPFGSTTCYLRTSHEKNLGGGGGFYTYDLYNGLCTGLSSSPTTYDSGWLDVYAQNIYTNTDGNAKFYFGGSTATLDFYLYEVLWEYILDDATDNTDIGDTDSGGSGAQTSLSWFDITSYASDDWQYPVNRVFRVSCAAGASNEAKLLRIFVCGEFAPKEKRYGTKIVADVIGRSGGFDDIIDDILTEDDLLGIPAASISIPSLSNSGAGALTDYYDNGFDFLEEILGQARCHGYWDWDSIYTVKFRENRGSLTQSGMVVSEVFSAIARSQEDMIAMANELELEYSYEYITGTFADSLIREDTDSKAAFGKTQRQVISLPFIRSQSEAEDIGDCMLSYLAWIFEQFIVEVGTVGLLAEPADIMRVNADGVFSSAFEAREVRLQSVIDDVISVSITGYNLG